MSFRVYKTLGSDPEDPAWQREQLISGIGCQACWELYVGGNSRLSCTCGK